MNEAVGHRFTENLKRQIKVQSESDQELLTNNSYYDIERTYLWFSDIC